MKKEQFQIVTAILLAVIVTLGIVAVPMVQEVMFSHKQVPTPSGSFGGVTIVSRYEIEVAFGNVSPLTNYSDCSLRFETPDGKSTDVDLLKNRYDYGMKDTFTALNSVLVASMDASGIIKPADHLTMQSSYPLTLGVWKLSLIYKPSEGAIATKLVVAPDMSSTPAADLTGGTWVTANHYRISLGIVNPTTSYAYVKLSLDPPGSGDEAGNSETFRLSENGSMEFHYNSTVTVFVTPTTNSGIMKTGDLFEIMSTQPSLAEGSWTLTLIYEFNNGRMVSEVFSST